MAASFQELSGRLNNRVGKQIYILNEQSHEGWLICIIPSLVIGEWIGF